MTKEYYGTIELGSQIDITDPCYDEDVWCRINRFPINPGTYDCFVEYASNKETRGFGKRVAKISIVKSHTDRATSYERKGSIGVDAGMAGFFAVDNVKIFEDVILAGEVEDVYLGDGYFCSSSGYGDGAYDVYAGYNNDGLVEVYIQFI